MEFPCRPEVLITRSDLRASATAYDSLFSAGNAFRQALVTLSQAAGDFASAVETCSKAKGAQSTAAEPLQACAGLQYLQSNWARVLADTLGTDFQSPLVMAYETYRATADKRQRKYDRLVTLKSRRLEDIEARSMRNGRMCRRDLRSFKVLLKEMQDQVQEMDQAKAEYYTDVLHAEEQLWSITQEKVAHLSRSQVEMWERLSSKANSDPVLDYVLGSIPDPFNAYGTAPSEEQLSSIVPQPSWRSNVSGPTRGSSPSFSARNDTKSVVAPAVATMAFSGRHDSVLSHDTSLLSNSSKEETTLEPSDSEDSRISPTPLFRSQEDLSRDGTPASSTMSSPSSTGALHALRSAARMAKLNTHDQNNPRCSTPSTSPPQPQTILAPLSSSASWLHDPPQPLGLAPGQSLDVDTLLRQREARVLGIIQQEDRAQLERERECQDHDDPDSTGRSHDSSRSRLGLHFGWTGWNDTKQSTDPTTPEVEDESDTTTVGDSDRTLEGSALVSTS